MMEHDAGTEIASEQLDDAIEAARDQLQEAEQPAQPKGKPGRKPLPPDIKDARKRLSDKNRRRRMKGAAEIGPGDADPDYDYLLGVNALPGASPESFTHAEQRATEPTAADRPASQRKTRADIERENAELRAQLDASESARIAAADQQLGGAIGETIGTAWGVALTFAPNGRDPRAQLSESDRAALGAAWAPVLAPYLSSVAQYVPVVSAAMVTYRVFSDRASIAWRDPQEVQPAAEPTPRQPSPIDADDADDTDDAPAADAFIRDAHAISVPAAPEGYDSVPPKGDV